MNLEELNLVELNAQEVQETEGGWLDWFINWGSPGWGWNPKEDWDISKQLV
jgi:hypothetical protein